MTISANVVVERMEQGGYRLTPARRVVAASIAASPHSFSAEEVCSQVPGIGRATVYRTVKLLLQLGLLCKVALQDGAPRYSLAPLGHHHHIVCVRCGAISDFRQCNLDDLTARLQAALGGELVGHRLEVYSLCYNCQLEKRANAGRGKSLKAGHQARSHH